MRTLSKLALAAAAAAALSGTALAAEPTRTLTVPLGDGSTVAIDYVGDVAPKVRILPAQPAPWPVTAWALPDFAQLDRMFADLSRRHAEMIRRMETLWRQSALARPGINLASAGALPEGATSVSVVSVTSDGKTCTRTTETVSQGPGKPPKVTTRVSGDCGPQPAGSGPAAVHQS